MRALAAALFFVAACSARTSGSESDAPPATPDAVIVDAQPAIDGAPDADPAGSEATNFEVDPAHDTAQPDDRSPRR